MTPDERLLCADADHRPVEDDDLLDQLAQAFKDDFDARVLDPDEWDQYERTHDVWDLERP